MRTKRVTVSLPTETADQLSDRAAAAGASSVSAYVSEAVAEKMNRDTALAWLDQLWGPADPQAVATARESLLGSVPDQRAS